jgi:membrane protease YdiL (CAAX protease family)
MLAVAAAAAAAATTQTSPAARAVAPAVEPIDWSHLGQVVPVALGSLLLAVWAGVFRRRSVVGPPRVSPGEPLTTLLVGTLIAFVVWVTLPSWYMAHSPGAAPAPVGVPVEMTPGLLRAGVIASVAALVILLVANAVRRRNGLARLGLGRSQIPRGVAAGVLGALILIGLVFLTSALTELLWHAVHYEHPKEHELLKVLRDRGSDPGVSMLLLLSAWVVAPLFEEVFFRGHVQTLIAWGLYQLTGRHAPMGRGFDVITPGGVTGDPNAPVTPTAAAAPSASLRWVAIVVTSLLFAAVHAGWMAPPIFVLSMCVGYAYERTGNLWTCITMHAAFNITSTLIFLRMG